MGALIDVVSLLALPFFPNPAALSPLNFIRLVKPPGIVEANPVRIVSLGEGIFDIATVEGVAIPRVQFLLRYQFFHQWPVLLSGEAKQVLCRHNAEVGGIQLLGTESGDPVQRRLQSGGTLL